MILAMAKDIRAIIIKLADRLHNMRTLEYMSEGKEKGKGIGDFENINSACRHRLGYPRLNGN